MIENLPQLRQPTPNSCLPTAVRSVLLWHGEQVSPDEVSEWCGEDADGCVLDLAIDGLRSAGFDVEELIGASEAEARTSLRDTIADTDDAQPVIVTLQDIFLNPDGDHAVVVIDVRFEGDAGIERAVVVFMDPATGTIVHDATGRFWRNWSFAGRRAFVIRP